MSKEHYTSLAGKKTANDKMKHILCHLPIIHFVSVPFQLHSENIQFHPSQGFFQFFVFALEKTRVVLELEI